MKRYGSWMQTASGAAYWPLDPRAEEVNIIDIAHSLAMQCRYGGHCARFYSVAEHSVHVSRLVPSDDALTGLMHDATEAYCSDVIRPLKKYLANYAEIEQRNWLAIAQAYNLPKVLPQSVHDADIAMLFAEQKELMSPPPRLGWGMGLTTPIVAHTPIFGWTPARAKNEFLQRFWELREEQA